ncbi:MAG: hypothetical protein IPK26_03670 [Planctomycetes bacterium]|nr:hypothetical protein [Planctomycetota bacterium]
MSRHGTTIAVLALVAIAVPLTNKLLTRDASPVVEQLAGAPARAEPGALPAGREPVRASLMTAWPLPPVSKQPADGYIEYPDGSLLPPLNGVAVAPPMSFTPSSPFTPVVARVRDAAGVEWYRHENGARSTTFVDGRGVSLAMIVMPIELPKGRKPFID